MATDQHGRNVVYVIGSANSSRVKIGTSKDVSKRLADIQRMSPEPLEVLWQTAGSYRLEGALHSRFADRRVHGEWFDFNGENPVKLIEEAVNSFNHSSRLIAKWMAADDWSGDPEEGALRFVRGLTYLHRGFDESLKQSVNGSDLDRCGEILSFGMHYLACFFGILSFSAGDSDQDRAEAWDRAASAMGAAQTAIMNAVSREYRWGSLPDFADRDSSRPFTDWGCKLHWSVPGRDGLLPCRHLHEGQEIPDSFDAPPERW